MAKNDILSSKLITFLLVLCICYLLLRVAIVYAIRYFDQTLPKTRIVSSKEHTQDVSDIQRQLIQSSNRITMSDDKTSHLYGLKKIKKSDKIDLSKLDTIIEINTERGYVRLGGKANLLSTIKILNNYGYSLKVVPDADHLTIGGLYSGIGGGATTFKHGAFFCSVRQIEVITGNGDILIANDHQHSDLFRLMPSSLGSLGYVLSIWLDIQPIEKYVFSETQHYTTYSEYIAAIENAMTSEIDFLDGTIFNRNDFVLITGKITGYKNPNLPHYGHSLDIPYYERVKQGYRGYFNYHDFVFRWDVDGYYSLIDDRLDYFFFRQKWFRKIFFDKQLMRETRLRAIFKPFMNEMTDNQINQDVGDFMIPRNRSEEFFEWFDKEIHLYPLYMCPITFTKSSPFIQCDPHSIDFGVGYGVSQTRMKSTILLQKCMRKAYQLNGDMLKYISIYHNPDEFWSFYPIELKREYENCKKKHDPNNRFFSIAEKLILPDH